MKPKTTAQWDDTLGNIPKITVLMQELAAERRDPDLFDLATAIDYLTVDSMNMALLLALDWCDREIRSHRPGNI